ncbi:MAG: hypothetical protein KAY46_12470 [Burkholderiaceae bacterium]|nr:hypothetical protein [Burkholderiaceae bacterium]
MANRSRGKTRRRLPEARSARRPLAKPSQIEARLTAFADPGNAAARMTVHHANEVDEMRRRVPPAPEFARSRQCAPARSMGALADLFDLKPRYERPR